MTVRAIALKSDGSGSAHADHSTTLPSGKDAIFVYDDSKVKTLGGLRIVFRELLAQAAGSSYFTP